MDGDGLCLTTDVDIFLSHMNNARYVRELDFARSFFYDRCGIFREIKKNGGKLVQGATAIRYRRPMPVFALYKITTELIYWDDKNIYTQHEFVKLSDKFVHATVLSKQSIVGSAIHVPDIIEQIEPGAIRFELSEELSLWMKSLSESSLKFKRLREEELNVDTTAFLQDP
ncbi:protein THEM6-like [Copidosoma floridanum]|uniref:protein THEM6-like n=1 Tax=Copidosoma floridanum TaxID=29053 RepID=UPI0006C94CF3|nr:protein THEM6-like [Copidosoma floridanum]